MSRWKMTRNIDRKEVSDSLRSASQESPAQWWRSTEGTPYSVGSDARPPYPSPPRRGRSGRALRNDSTVGYSSQRGERESPLLGERNRVRAVQQSVDLEPIEHFVRAAGRGRHTKRGVGDGLERSRTVRRP